MPDKVDASGHDIRNEHERHRAERSLRGRAALQVSAAVPRLTTVSQGLIIDSLLGAIASPGVAEAPANENLVQRYYGDV